MKRVCFTMIVGFIIGINTIAAIELSSVDKQRVTSETDKLVKKYIDLDIFSGVVLIAEKGTPFYHKPFGLANREMKIPNTINTKFDIGSMNKTFTKIVVYQLLEEGKLSLDDKLGKYLFGFPQIAANNITIDHLLNHQSGYGDYHSREYFDLPQDQKTILNIVERIRELPLHFEPGTEQEYSNAGYILLGAIIEKVTGESYQQNIKKRIVEPLGLKETYVDSKDQVPERSIGYFKDTKGEIQNNEGFLEIPKSDGGFKSNTSDILKFYQEYFYGNKLLGDEIKNSLEEFNYYDEVRKTEGAIPQAGGFEGANTVIYEILRDKISIIVFANMDEPVAEQLGAGILAIVRGKEPGEPALPAIQNVYRTLVERSPHYVRENFEELTKNFHPSDPKDLILNQVGYTFLFDGQIDKAIEAFQLNVEMFPNIANCYDSLGEALLEKGDREEALKNYKKALELNHEMPSAKEKVKELSK